MNNSQAQESTPLLEKGKMGMLISKYDKFIADKKWTMLGLVNLMVLGSNYCYGNPSPIEVTLEDDLGISQTQYSYLFSVYSIPNLILPLFGGLCLDFFGIK